MDAVRRDSYFAAVALAQSAIEQITVTAEEPGEAGINDIERGEIAVAGRTYGTYGNDAKKALRGINSNYTFTDNSFFRRIGTTYLFPEKYGLKTRFSF